MGEARRRYSLRVVAVDGTGGSVGSSERAVRGGSMRYEMIRLAQLVFFLFVMFAAFLGGLAIGWYRWGRQTEEQPGLDLRDGPRPWPPSAGVKSDLFAPESDASTTDPALFSPAELSSGERHATGLITAELSSVELDTPHAPADVRARGATGAAGWVVDDQRTPR